jgi:MerR family copper efflux transcriptional regulator
LKKWMTIAELGRHSGVGVETVRYYQRLGLLAVPPMRDQRSHRRYGAESMAELRFVRRCKVLGFSLKQIGVLVRMRRVRSGSCGALHAKLAELSEELDAKRRELDSMRHAVGSLLEACEGEMELGECGALARLEHRDAADGVLGE